MDFKSGHFHWQQEIFAYFKIRSLCWPKKDIEFADFQVNLSKNGLVTEIYCFSG